MLVVDGYGVSGDICHIAARKMPFGVLTFARERGQVDFHYRYWIQQLDCTLECTSPNPRSRGFDSFFSSSMAHANM